MSHDHDDFAVEPIRGLPEKLPPGEHILWQGSPDWWQLAKDVFHIRIVIVYFAVLIVWRSRDYWAAGDHDVIAGIVVGLSLLPIALVGVGLFALLAWLSARTSVHTITNRRVVMRIGIALPTTINIPFAVVGSAGLRARANGSGDIVLSVSGPERIAFSTLWPHVRPWRLAKPQPMLTAIPDAKRLASILASALEQATMAGRPVSPVTAPEWLAVPSSSTNAPWMTTGRSMTAASS